MGLQQRTVRKLLREDFPGTNPLIVKATERAKLGADLKGRLERFDGVDTKGEYVREEDKARHVCSFGLLDPDAYYYYRGRDGFQLLLDDEQRLTIKAGYA